MTQTDSDLPTPSSATFDRRDFLWKILVRFDSYIGTTISRAAAVTALNALVVGGIMIKAGDILAAFDAHSGWRTTALFALVDAGLAALGSTALSFLALVPYRGRGQGPSSLIFFGHVAARKLDEYIDAVASLDEGAATREVAGQVHDMAKGLAHKFKLLHWAALCTVGVLLPSLALLGISVLFGIVLERVK